MSNTVKNYIELQDVSYHREQSVLLDNISFNVKPGQFLVVGASDIAGKTTLLKLCIGLISPHKGVIKIWDKPIADFSYTELQSLRLKTGTVSQTGILISNFTVWENIALPLKYHLRLGSNELTKRINKYLELLDIVRYANERPAGLPLEIRVLTNLARALAIEPELLLLDELFASLSHPNMEKVIDCLKGLKAKNGLTCIATTKTINIISSFTERALVDYLIIIESGRITEQGPCREIRDKLVKKSLSFV